jgi:alpha-amylase/alpha-mannosidase (GH57 family)
MLQRCFSNGVSMAASERYVCIHGHFYQPPRENPWLGTVETQDSAAPYHDWNDRITAECYATNGASRIVDNRNEILRIQNNYARMSFNFGPTLLSWLAAQAPRTYRMILDADKRSQERFGGHGSAMAQVYNHIIMPLASTRDKVTQIRWGIADFVGRFGRKPEGMWLAETAVDTETLELLAEHGILFTVLAPSQCGAVRPRLSGAAEEAAQGTWGVLSTSAGNGDWSDFGGAGHAAWIETPDGSVDSTRPYLVQLKTGRSIGVFFYDGPRSRAIAFEGLLNSGEGFARRLVSGFRDDLDRAQLVHVATDGESYGHHHKHGEMALSYALKYIEQQGLARLTNYGEYLAKFPPGFEARIVENSSWSCVHGVERWRSDCGCNGGHVGWNQRWRGPLREALDWLRDTVGPLSERAASDLFKDVWAARDAYIDVVLRGVSAVDAFFAAHAAHKLGIEERVRALKLMELQRHTQLMYTSCGWFFDEISGIETVQIIAYASHVLQLATEIFRHESLEHPSIEPIAWEDGFVERLRMAQSNLPEQGNGAEIYLRSVKTAQVGLEQVAAHYAISSVFTTYPERAQVYSYDVRRLEYDVASSGRARLVVGRALVASRLTDESQEMAFAVLYFGDQNINAAVKPLAGEDGGLYAGFAKKATGAVARADFQDAMRQFDGYFGTVGYSLTSLFRDEQRRILKLILNSTLREVESSLSKIYEEHASLLHFLSQAGLPKPPALALAAGFSVNAGLRRAIESRPIDAVQVRALLALAEADQLALDTSLLSYLADQQMKWAMVELYAQPEKGSAIDEALLIASTLRELPFELNLWQAQNIWYDTLKEALKRSGRRSTLLGMPQLESATVAEWWAKFDKLGRCLRIVVKELVVEEEAVPSVPVFAGTGAVPVTI